MRTVLNVNSLEEIVISSCWSCGNEAQVECDFGMMCFSCEAKMPSESITPIEDDQCHCGGELIEDGSEFVCIECSLVHILMEATA